MLNCARICETAANVMLTGGRLHQRVCEVCATYCEACAKSCEALQDMGECVRACRRCAELCREMAGT
jgi:hypothetical protein